jgi:hypothetical protein
VALAVAGLSLALAQPVAAQGLPEPPSPGGLDQLLANPGRWLTTAFNALLFGLGRDSIAQAVGFMSWLLSNGNSGNIITRTPPELSYNSEAVRGLWGTLRIVGNAALAVVTAWGGLNLIVHPHIRAPYHGALELVPRVLLGGVLVNTSLDWGRFVIDLNNALCQAVGAAAMPAWSAVLQPNAGAVLMSLIAIVIYLVMGLLLFVQMLMRLALLDALLILAPVALLCWVLPQTYGWARLWFSTFFAAVFVQFVQVLVLQLGTGLIDHLPSLLPDVGADPLNGGRLWLATLLLGVAVLQLARQVPRYMPWYPSAGPAFGWRSRDRSQGSSKTSSSDSSRSRDRGR